MSLAMMISNKIVEMLEEELLNHAPEIQDAALAELKIILDKLINKIESITTPNKGI